jgi:hypothetical protein
MNRGRVGEKRGSKELDGCPLTATQAMNMTLDKFMAIMGNQEAAINVTPLPQSHHLM